MDSIKSYVLGFAFDDLGRVVLINKQRPEWQKHKWNGVGGLIEPFDDGPATAMAREFREETGVEIPAEEWKQRGTMSGPGWKIYVFTVTSQNARYVVTCTDEQVSMFLEHQLFSAHTLDNVRALVRLCHITDDVPFFELTYGSTH